jgi:hypothetical protein
MRLLGWIRKQLHDLWDEPLIEVKIHERRNPFESKHD